MNVTNQATAHALERNKIPALDRAMAVFAELEQRPEGMRIRDLVTALDLPRTTVYRILNSLELHQMVRRDAAGTYTLGPRLLTLASRVVSENTHADLRALAQQHLHRLAQSTGQSAKLSVIDGDNALVIATATGVPGLSLSVAPGQRIPLHAGAAGKVLMAYLPAATLDAMLAGGLASYTAHTIAEEAALRAECAQIRARGWAEDLGEFTPNIEAYAAPVTDHSGTTLAALSCPFLSGIDAGQRDGFRNAVITTAGAISADLPPPRM